MSRDSARAEWRNNRRRLRQRKVWFLYSLLIAIRLAVHQSDYRPVLSTLFALGLTILSAYSAHWTQPLDRALVRRPDAQGLGSELGTDLS
ncbi:hypothetical protein [Streptacidiphilus pinicola]|nr:hypothetical protein [Streptacidiphilus pinicola]